MSLELVEFKTYVTNSGVDFDSLSNDEKGQWRERFDKMRLASSGIYFCSIFPTKYIYFLILSQRNNAIWKTEHVKQSHRLETNLIITDYVDSIHFLLTKWTILSLYDIVSLIIEFTLALICFTCNLFLFQLLNIVSFSPLI